MSATSPFRVCAEADLYHFLAAVAFTPIHKALTEASNMQRLRVTTLPDPVMESVCERLQSDPRWAARMLTNGAAPGCAWKASATKIIELRNTLEKPLVVFVPSGMRTAAEDSLDIATFSELSLAGMTRDLVDELLGQIPSELTDPIKSTLEYLRRERIIRHVDEEVSYLLTIKVNGAHKQDVGRALCVFGLLPDADLLDKPNHLRRLSLNYKSASELANVQRPLRERIGRLSVKAGTIQNSMFAFLRSRHTDSARIWASELACSPEYRHLCLEHWEFEEEDEHHLRIIVEPLELPMQTEDRIGGAARLPVLDLTGRQGLKVSVRSIPKPAEVPSWKSFRIQILPAGDSDGSVAWESNNYSKPSGRNQKFSRTVKVSDLNSLEEGTYYLKVDAYDQNGVLLTQRRPIDPDDPNGRAENESPLFLVTTGTAEGEVEDPQPRVVRVPSLNDAYMAVASRWLNATKPEDDFPSRAAMTGTWNQPIAASVRGDVVFELHGTAWNGYGISIPGIFRRLELAILEHPSQLGFLRLDCIQARNTSDLNVERRTGRFDLPDWPEAVRFLESRKDVFEALLSQHLPTPDNQESRSTGLSIVETADLVRLADSVRRYAESYLALAQRLLQSESVQRSHPGALKAFAQVDLIELTWRRSLGDPGRALLLSPTHPIRLLWHLQHALVCDVAVSAAQARQPVPSWSEYLKQLREGFVPTNTPLVLFDSRGRGYIDQGPLTDHWSLYLPEGVNGDATVDVPSCRDRVRSLLGLRPRGETTLVISDREIATRATDYLEQHPYVDQLRINVFNPGDGQALANALRFLERAQADRGVSDEAGRLRYSIHMFGAGPEHLEGMGDSLESLLDPDRQVAESDVFALTTSNHLLPKLVFARNTVDDFLREPRSFPAHLTLFLEHFNVRSHLGRIDRAFRSAYVGGLLQEPDISLEANGVQYSWAKSVRPVTASAPSRDESLLCRCHATVQSVQAAAAAGQPQASEVAPVVALHLNASSLSLLKHSHEISDWVITIDRHLGVEYFDSARTSDEFGYLLDFSPATAQSDQPRVMLTTRCGSELSNLVKPIFDRLGWPLSDAQAESVLETLRSLSGRLALRLLSSPHNVGEVLGLLLARWLLQHAGLLDERVIIPLDAHQSWFRRRAEEGADSLGSSQRADLLLVSFDPAVSTLRLTVVEVKLRDEIAPADRAYLYRQMKEQADNTVRWLRERFDPHLYAEPRADFLLCAKELTTTLAFYIRRGNRYGLISDDVAKAALTFVQNLDSGYHLDVQTIGIVFEQHGVGSHTDEDEPGYVVYRFGADVAHTLLVDASPAAICIQGDENGSRTRSSDTAHKPIQTEGQTNKDLESIRSALGSGTSLRSSVQKEDALESRTSQEHQAPSPNDETCAQPEIHSPSPEHDAESTGPGLDKTPAHAAPSVPSADDSPGPEPTPSPSVLRPEVLLGANELTAQYGIVGRLGSARVAVDLTGCNTISLFGVQGFGKSYTLGVIAEMAARQIANINVLPSPLASVIFHYHKSDAYAPEFATAVKPNQKQREVERLERDYGALPTGLEDLLILTPEAKVEQRRREFPGVEIRPIKFSSGELGAESWKFLLGAYGNDSLYVRQLIAIMRRHRTDLTLARFEEEIQHADLAQSTRRLAEDRMNLARPYINDDVKLAELLRPGRTIIVDLRDEWIEKEEALGLFVVMMRIFASARHNQREFNKLMIFDEAHKYITESDLIGQVVETIREMRHQATSVMIASQDPLSVPRPVVELTSLLILHRMTSPQWLKHLKSAISALDDTTEAHLSSLQPGEALVWAQRSTDKRFTQRPQKINVRPRCSQHGGGTKTAVEGETVR